MREIKFRGKAIDGWHYGDLEYRRATKVTLIHSYNDDGTYFRQEQVNSNTIGQFTGLHDKNGKEIYEGDIIQLNYPQWNYIVFWNDDRLCFEYRRVEQEQSYSLSMNEMQLRCYEVIGNIHDNPELLKGGEQ